MRVPQVSERIKEVPAQALRGVFAGIGQLLLITDKLRNKPPAGEDVPQARTPEPPAPPAPPEPAATANGTGPAEDAVAAEPVVAAEPAATAEPAVTPEPVVTPEAAVAAEPVVTPEAAVAAEAVVTPEATVTPEAAVVPEPTVVAAAELDDGDTTGNARLLGEEARQPEAAAQAQAVQEPQETALPLPNYDALTVASLRARLRNLSADQVRQLAEYERAHAARPEVITMFERRIAKLESGG
jgi:hypothetical protein